MDLKNEIEQQANQWLMRENEGLSKQERVDIELWLENINNKKIYEENKRLIEECLELDQDFIKEIEDEVIKEPRGNNILYKSRYIAASVIIVSVMLFTAFKTYNFGNPTFSQSYISKNEKILNITLPDNSKVDLDVKSNIKVCYYNDKRLVDLNNGKALFTVTKNKTKPFIIKVGKTVIEVLGTKFEVVNLNDITTVNVQEGLVKIDYIYDEQNSKKKTLKQLKKSETLTLNSFGKIIDFNKIDKKQIANWKRDIIEFDKTTLKDAVNLFQRYSNQRVEFQTYELSQLTISGKFSTKHYESFLESITLIYPVKVVKKKNFIKIVKN